MAKRARSGLRILTNAIGSGTIWSKSSENTKGSAHLGKPIGAVDILAVKTNPTESKIAKIACDSGLTPPNNNGAAISAR